MRKKSVTSVFLRHVAEAHEMASNSGAVSYTHLIRVWPHSEIFAGRRPAKMLVGELPKPAGLRDKLSQSPGAMRLLSAACRYRSWALFSRPSVTPSR